MILKKPILFNTFILQLIMLIIEFGKEKKCYINEFSLKLISTKNII